MSDDILSSLYPFAEGNKSVPEVTDADLSASIEQKVAESVAAKQRFFSEQQADFIAAARLMAQVYENKGQMFTMGNGGSNCDASHLALEFLHPVTAGRPALPALNLGCDVTTITATSNDLGFENAYVRQLIAYAREGDLLVGFSTSGHSGNLMRAFEKAKELGLHTLGFAGMDGGEMARSEAVDICLVAPTNSVHRVQECHLSAYHILWDLVHTLLANARERKVK